jgi:hypothetical protein
MESLSLTGPPRLETLPLDVLLIILAQLTTARGMLHLASTCKRLQAVVRVIGWRIFVRGRFDSFSFPQDIPDDEWKGWARDLTWQSRAWDRRAFVVNSMIPPDKRLPRNVRNARTFRGPRTQTTPCHIVVDAASRSSGKLQEETVVWGAGEDIVARIRHTGHAQSRSEEWRSLEGSSAGFKSGKDDITSISILRDSTSSDDVAGLLVGRASGDLRLLSMEPAGFGRTKLSFRPSADDSGAQFQQNEVQSFDTNGSLTTLAMTTKDSVILYPLDRSSSDMDQVDSHADDTSHVAPNEAVNLRNALGSRSFKFVRSIKFMDNGDLAVGMISSSQALRYLTITPTGTELVSAAKMLPTARCSDLYLDDHWEPQSVRDLLPVNMASIAGGNGNVILSSYDDGTIRLQDIRTPSAIDTIYQDHFEVLTPVGPLLSYGAERFIAGSARTATLKIFDYRWTKRYHYTDSLPCGDTLPSPEPKPPTMVFPPSHSNLDRCNHLLGQECRRHALSRADFYRPNCNVYLPIVDRSAAPVYSLAKSSDLSPTVYAGLSGELVEMNLRGGIEDVFPQHKRTGANAAYTYRKSIVSIIETGDGIALNDISRSQRVPEIRSQLRRSNRDVQRELPVDVQRQHRLDDLFIRSYTSDPM